MSSTEIIIATLTIDTDSPAQGTITTTEEESTIIGTAPEGEEIRCNAISIITIIVKG
jgi:hypothetical protein